ncbi:MAG: T9SS type A sorting domain-containing protein, partial [Bacteroidales bacterium]|nr:T9SS type A sorting domain-containing protein [Bacteroidales bacterium]MDD3892346.1 T9SS type A sorting domain-containing protein [Bacteroidales bacterium]
ESAQGIIYTVTYNGFKTAKGTVNVEDIDVTVNVMLNPTTGTPVSLSEEVRVYPNPFSSQLMLEGVAHVRQVEVINLIGQRMMLMEHNGNQTLTLPTENLQAGVYLIRLTGEDGLQLITRVIKQ